jgi:hypothetical protein
MGCCQVGKKIVGFPLRVLVCDAGGKRTLQTPQRCFLAAHEEKLTALPSIVILRVTDEGGQGRGHASCTCSLAHQSHQRSV